MKKRILSILLTACLLMGLLPTAALAAGGTAVTFTAISGTNGNSGENYENLFDNDSTTKWCVSNFQNFNSGNPCYVIFKASEAIAVTGYSITTGNDNSGHPGRNPKDWTLYGCNDYNETEKTGTWASIDTVTDDEVLQDENYTTYNYYLTETAAPYQYFKLEITATKGSSPMQMSEFTLMGFTAISGTAGNKNEGYEKLFDGNSKTKWCMDFDSDNGAYVIFQASAPMAVTGYSITTGNDNQEYSGRNPKSWTLYGSTESLSRDAEGWQAIDIVTDDEVLQDKNCTKYFFEVNGQATAYQYFKLEITATKGADVMQMSEFTLTSCEHAWAAGTTTPPTCTTKGYTEYTCGNCGATKIGGETSPLGHDFTGEDGACTRCGETKAELYTFDVSKGRVIIMDDEWPGYLSVYYLVGGVYTKAEGFIAPSETITVTGSTTEYELHVKTATPVKIKASDLHIDRSKTGYAYAMSLDTSGANVTLILEDENSFAGGSRIPGISVSSGSTLTIQGNGSLTATGGSGAAGIGGGTVKINSSAVIFASSIGDKSQQSNWSGIIFEGNDGQVYGDQTLMSDLTIPSGATLTIRDGAALTIPEDKTLTVNGTLNTNDALYVDGGALSGTVNGAVYYPLTLKNCTAPDGVIVTHNGKTYAAAGTSVTLTATFVEYQMVTGWTVTGTAGSTSGSSDTKTITMPANAVTVTAEIAKPVQVNTAAGLENAIKDGEPYIQLTGDIKISGTLELQNKEITLDLNGYVLESSGSRNVIKLVDGSSQDNTSLTLIDSNPTKVNMINGKQYKGGVINDGIIVTASGSGSNNCQLYANGGSVTGDVALQSVSTSIRCTSDTPTAFYSQAVSNSNGSIYGGMYYAGINGDAIQIKGKTVTFKNGDSTYARQVVVAGEGMVVAPIEPTKAGYTFLGWYTEDDQAYTFGSTVSSDITLTAKWEIIPATAPTVETLNGLTLTYGYTTGNVLTVSASAAADANYTLSYQWYSKADSTSDGTIIEGATGSSYTIPTGKNAGTTEYYYCVVTATRTDNGETDSTTSNVATVTVSKASISPVVSIEDWTYGDEASTPSVTGNPGGGTVTYTYTGTANDGTDYNSTAAPTKAGSYTVKAEVAETDNYEAGSATADFTISPKDITVTITPNGGCYGNVTPATATLSGVVGEDDVSVTLTYTGAANDGTEYESSTTVPENAGSYTVTASISDPNYNLTGTVTADFTISPKAITVTITPNGGCYGNVIPATAELIGLVAGDTTEATLTYTGTANDGTEYESSITVPENAGSYTVTASISDPNYKLTGMVTADFVIDKAAQAAPAAPEVKEKTWFGVMLKDIADSTQSGAKVQYSIDGGETWQDSPLFIGLKSATKYSFVARYVETDNYYASPASEAIEVRTNGVPVSVSTYPPNVEQTEGGRVTTSPSYPTAGSEVTITPKPEDGYEVDQVIVTDKNGNPVEVTDNGDGTYSFKQPDGKVTVTVTFKEKTRIVFVDVPASAYYYDAVYWAVENGITTGTGDGTTFSPNAPCTRAQAVTFLWRAAGCPAPKSSVNPFTDVKEGSYCYEAVLWAVENGITKGTGDGTTFSPDAVCTRAQIVTFLWRAQGAPATGSANPFKDVAADAYYIDAVLWAVEKGITKGTGDGTTFSPNADCTRAQIVTFLWRCMK